MKRTLALCLLVAACGKTLPLLPDGAGIGDAGIDAMPLPDASQDIGVTVLSTDQAATPLTGIAVIMLDATGTLIASGTTDGNGQFSHIASAGASVTIVRTINDNSGGADLTTIAGANPGDNLVFGAPAGNVAETGAMTIIYPTQFDGNSYEADDGCSTASTTSGNTMTLEHYSDCAATADLLLTSVTSANVSNHYIDVPNQMFTSGGQVDLTTLSWSDTPSKTFAYTDLPSALGTLLHINATVGNMSNGRASYRIEGNAPVSGATTSVALFVPPAGTQLEIESVIARTDSENWGSQEVYELSTQAAQYSLDVDTALASWIDTTSVAVDAATRVVSWTTGAADGAQEPNSAKAVIVDAYYTRVGGNFHWRMYAPTANSVTLPTLPSDVDSNGPTSSDSVSGQVLYLGSDGSYDSLRNAIDFLNYDAEAFLASTPSVTRITLDGIDEL